MRALGLHWEPLQEHWPRCQAHCSALSQSARGPELLTSPRPDICTPQLHIHLCWGQGVLTCSMLGLGADGGRELLRARDVLLMFSTLPVNPKLLPQPYCCCYYETKSTITAFFRWWFNRCTLPARGFVKKKKKKTSFACVSFCSMELEGDPQMLKSEKCHRSKYRVHTLCSWTLNYSFTNGWLMNTPLNQSQT